MKKSLVLAMLVAMGFSATALAANPFSDVPAGHWAYGSIAKLAQGFGFHFSRRDHVSSIGRVQTNLHLATKPGVMRGCFLLLAHELAHVVAQ